MSVLKIAEKNNGIITVKIAEDNGIHRSRLSEAAAAGTLVRVAPGIYQIADSWEDEYAITQLRFPQGIFSHGTALYLHDLTDRTPAQLMMTFPRSYNATAARTAGVIVKTCSSQVLNLGRTSLTSPIGNKVNAYDVERTLCDMLRGQIAVDTQIVNPAFKAYMRFPGKSVHKLLTYAKQLGVEKKVRNYLEVLL